MTVAVLLAHLAAFARYLQDERNASDHTKNSYHMDIEQFAREYNQLTAQAATRCESSFLEDSMIVGTSAMIATELDCIVNQYTDKFCNPMLMWGKYRRHCCSVTLPISFQFHHVQMDGGHAASFLESLQQEILNLR